MRGGDRAQVDVVVVQAWQQGGASGVEVVLTGERTQAGGALGDAAARDANVGDLEAGQLLIGHAGAWA